RRRAYGRSPPLVGQNVTEQPVVHLVAYGTGGDRRNLRSPCRGNRVVRNFDDTQICRRNWPINLGEKGNFARSRIGVRVREIFVVGFEVDLQVAVVGLDESTGDDGSRKARSVPNEARCFIPRRRWMLRSRLGATADYG